MVRQRHQCTINVEGRLSTIIASCKDILVSRKSQSYVLFLLTREGKFMGASLHGLQAIERADRLTMASKSSAMDMNLGRGCRRGVSHNIRCLGRRLDRRQIGGIISSPDQRRDLFRCLRRCIASSRGILHDKGLPLNLQEDTVARRSQPAIAAQEYFRPLYRNTLYKMINRLTRFTLRNFSLVLDKRSCTCFALRNFSLVVDKGSCISAP